MPHVCGICNCEVASTSRHNHDACARNLINLAIERCAYLAEQHTGNREVGAVLRATKIEFVAPQIGGV